jgi:hypothetical protein
MTIQRTDNEIIIKLPSDTNIDGVQRLLDYISFKEITSKKPVVDQNEIDQLASEVNKGWWQRNKNRFTEQ